MRGTGAGQHLNIGADPPKNRAGPLRIYKVLERLQGATAKGDDAFAKQTLEKIQGPMSCPLSMGIWFRQIREAQAGRSLPECLRVNYRLFQSMTHFRPNNIIAGIRYTLGGKAAREGPPPAWEPKTSAELTDALLDEAFACPDLKGEELAL